MRFTATFILVGCLALAAACDRQDHGNGQTVYNGLTMGTSYNIKLTLPPAGADREAIRQGIEKVLNSVNQRMSTYLDDSELSMVNQAKSTDRIPISPELADLLAQALALSWYTNGAFDITVGPLVNLWGFGPVKHEPVIPPRESIDQTLARTGYTKIKVGLNPNYIQKTEPDLYLDLSGIAKGYGVDQVAAYLESQGVVNYMIEIGGEIKARGVNAGGSAWRIGVEKPVTDERAVERIIQLENMGMATSGDYRNYFEIDGKRYSHIIDPATGYPVSHNLVSVSVLEASNAQADALATALIVMGPEEGYEFASNNRITAMFIIRSGNGFIEKYSGSFERFLIKQ